MLQAFNCHVTVWVVLYTNHAGIADYRSNVCNKIAFYVIVAMRNHRTMESEQYAIERQSVLDLTENLFSHLLIGAFTGYTSWACCKTASLN
jgi:hypothetical protein